MRALVEAARPDTCPEALAREAAALIFAGDHDATAALVASAQATSWSALVRALRGEAEPEANAMDNGARGNEMGGRTPWRRRPHRALVSCTLVRDTRALHEGRRHHR